MIPITKSGYEKLEKELYELKHIKRPAVIEAIATARGYGDLKENAEYHSAREEQGFIEGRILEIEDKMTRLKIIDTENLPIDRVVFGSKFSVENVETGEILNLQLVSEEESDIKQGFISNVSPLGKNVIGKKKDESILVKTPKGIIEYVILSIG